MENLIKQIKRNIKNFLSIKKSNIIVYNININ